MTTDAEVLEALRGVVDPELGINVVDLGLVYGVAVDDGSIRVTMTTTSDQCPMGDVMLAAARACLAANWPAHEPDVVYTAEPPWTPARISMDGRRMLGIPG